MTRLRTMCPMNCHPTLCGMLVDVEDGRLVAVQGDPDNPDSRGFLCMRGQASREIIGNPQRLLHPLIRARRGGDDWRRGDVGRSARPDRRAHAGGRAARPSALWSGHGALRQQLRHARRLAPAPPLRQSLRRQWWNPTMICWGLGAFGLGLTGMLETNTKEDMGEHAELILLWGANLASQPNTGAPSGRGPPARRPRRDDRRARDGGRRAVRRGAADPAGHATPRWRWR